MNLDIDIQSKRDSTIECACWQQHAVGGALKNREELMRQVPKESYLTLKKTKLCLVILPY
jgi:hypothetical protein